MANCILVKFLFLYIYTCLSLTYGQFLVISPSDKFVKKYINETYSASCKLSDGSTNVVWMGPSGQRIENSEEQSRVRINASVDSFGVSVIIERISITDGGAYSCADAIRGGRSTFNLTVCGPISFDTSLAEQSAFEGKMHLMQCNAQGYQPKISWEVDQTLPKSPKYNVTEDGLLIYDVTESDALRRYVCHASDPGCRSPNSKRMSITLRVKTKPKLIGSEKTEEWVVLGVWANLTCIVKADPAADLEWNHRNRILRPSDETVIFNEDNKSIFQVLVTSEKSLGEYVCRARNEVGEINRTITLLKAEKPPPPILVVELCTMNLVKIRVKSASIGEASQAAERQAENKRRSLLIVGFVVEYKTEAQPNWTTPKFSNYAEDEGFTIGGLEPSITYFIRAALKNTALIGEFSAPLNVTTPNATIHSSTKDGASSQSSSSAIIPLLLNILFSLFICL